MKVTDSKGLLVKKDEACTPIPYSRGIELRMRTASGRKGEVRICEVRNEYFYFSVILNSLWL